MGQKTGIEWTEATWNPIRGCSRVSEGCQNCYAETVAGRFSGPGQPYEGLIAKGGQWNGKVMVVDHKLDEPCRWSKPRTIFVNSMSDLFHPSVPFDVIAGIFGIMAAASWHTFQVLTKRPDRMLGFFRWIDNHPERRDFDSAQLRDRFPGNDWRPFFLAQKAAEIVPGGGEGLRVEIKGSWPLENVWLGVSVEDQATANERIPKLLKTPSAVRWASAEPLLGPLALDQWIDAIDHCGSCGAENPPQRDDRCPECGATSVLISTYGFDEAERYRSGERYDEDSAEGMADIDGTTPGIDWVVVGGESGANARPMHPDWPRSIRDQCQAAGVPFLFKQWGEFAPSPDGGLPDQLPDSAAHYFDEPHSPGKTWRFGKRRAGRQLDGRTWNQYPEVTE